MQKALLLLVVVAFIPRAAAAQGGNPLGPEFRVNTYTPSKQDYPAVASDSSGNFVVVWRSRNQNGSGSGVFGQRFANTGAPLGPEFRVNTYTTGDQWCADVASDASGNFVVVWCSPDQDGSESGIFGQRYGSTGGPLGPEFRVNTVTTDDQSVAGVSSDPSGNFVVVWASRGNQDDSDTGLFGQRYDNTGAALGPEFRINTYTTGYQGLPAVSSDPSGNFVVVWMTPSDYGGIYGQRYDSTGEPLGPEFSVKYPTYQPFPIPPAVDSDAAGNFLVVWTDRSIEDHRMGVFGQAFASSGAPLGRDFRVNTYTWNSSNLPTVTSVSSGHFFVVWNGLFGQDGSSSGVFGRSCCSSTGVLGPEFRVNTYTTDGQFSPAVSSDVSGNFVVVWTSPDGSDYGIFGQRYSAIAGKVMHSRVD